MRGSPTLGPSGANVCPRANHDLPGLAVRFADAYEVKDGKVRRASSAIPMWRAPSTSWD